MTAADITETEAWPPIGDGSNRGTVELLEWHCVAGGHLPDADTTVLMWVQDGVVSEWFAGWWDGEAWLDAASGGMVAGVVTHWAEPEGPAA